MSYIQRERRKYELYKILNKITKIYQCGVVIALCTTCTCSLFKLTASDRYQRLSLHIYVHIPENTQYQCCK